MDETNYIYHAGNEKNISTEFEEKIENILNALNEGNYGDVFAANAVIRRELIEIYKECGLFSNQPKPVVAINPIEKRMVNGVEEELLVGLNVFINNGLLLVMHNENPDLLFKVYVYSRKSLKKLFAGGFIDASTRDSMLHCRKQMECSNGGSGIANLNDKANNIYLSKAIAAYRIYLTCKHGSGSAEYNHFNNLASIVTRYHTHPTGV